MITKLQITNFRNLKSLTLDFTKKTSIITGKNDLGKSNSLNALMWLLTGTILTDKWGSGENDINSILPVNIQYGMSTSVSIWLKNGVKYTKTYECTWSKDTTKITGHSTSYLVNDVAGYTEVAFYDNLYKELGFTQNIYSKEIKESNLFVDPLYALQKLDAKQLRHLLVELGCSVSYETLYEMGFEELKEYQAKYQGKFEVMRKDLKNEIKGLETEIQDITSKLSTVADANFDSKKLDQLNAAKQDLIAKQERIKAGNVDTDILELKQQITNIKNSIELEKTLHAQNVRNYKSQKQMEIDNAKLKLEQKHNADAQNIKDQLAKCEVEIGILRNSISAYEKAITQSNTLIVQIQSNGKYNNEKKRNAMVKLEELRNAKYELTRCPVCGTEFAPDEQAFETFERDRNTHINECSKIIDSCLEEDRKLKEKFDAENQKKNEALKVIEETNNKLNEEQQKLIELRNQVLLVPYDEELEKNITKLQYELEHGEPVLDVSKLEKQLVDAESKLNEKETLSDATITSELTDLQVQIDALDEQIGLLYVERSKQQNKLEWMTQLTKFRTDLNNSESLLGKVNAFIQTMIRMINAKATEITGLTFVMLEENLTNDGIKEVCYATIDNVPFSNVNTAKKLEVGIQFIDRLKKILGANDLPILVDRIEGIDDVSKIDKLTNQQLICTRVSNEEEMRII